MQGQLWTRVCVPLAEVEGPPCSACLCPGRECPPGWCPPIFLFGPVVLVIRATSGVSGSVCQPADAGGPSAVCPEFAWDEDLLRAPGKEAARA